MSEHKPLIEGLRIERKAAPRAKPVNWTALVVVVVVLLLLGAGYVWRARASAVAVQTAVARESAHGGSGSERTVLNASGYVTARREATVSSKVTGKVTEVLIEEGMKVKEGQVLARLDDSNTKASLDVAVAQLDSARLNLGETVAQLKQANQEFERTTELVKQKISSQSDYDLAESNAKLLQARLERQQRDVTVAERTVAMNQQYLDDMVIRAPFSGVITTKDSQPGEMISPVSAGGGFTRTGIGTVVDMDSLEIEIDVNESYINRVSAGQPVEATLDAYPDWKIPCSVIAIIPTADRQKSTVKVRVGFNHLDPRILPEMSVKVAFHETATNAVASHGVLVPKSSLHTEDGKDVVFVVANGKAERRAVTVADMQGDDALVSAGVTSGEEVVVNSPMGLVDGVAVKPGSPAEAN
jgi:RND family efflux transporter MFP subunit